jgi:hypothetical protein
VTLREQAVFDEAADRLAHRHARQREVTCEVAFARQRFSGRKRARLDRVLDGPAQTQVRQRALGRRTFVEPAIFAEQCRLHSFIIPMQYHFCQYMLV